MEAGPFQSLPAEFKIKIGFIFFDFNAKAFQPADMKVNLSLADLASSWFDNIGFAELGQNRRGKSKGNAISVLALKFYF